MIEMAGEKRSSTTEDFRKSLDAAIEEFNIAPLTDKQVAQLIDHYSMLCRWNQKINLTRITDAEDAARLHYGESLFGARFADKATRVIDLGSGAGFPAIPLAVVCTLSHVTALEASQRKAIFLEEAKDRLRLENFSVAECRLEEFDLSGYDLLTSRAIDQAEDIMPQVIESLVIDQRMMLYCGRELLENLSKQFASKFVIEVHSIPHTDGRMIVIFSRV